MVYNEDKKQIEDKKYAISSKVFTDIIDYLRKDDNFIIDKYGDSNDNLSKDQAIFINNDQNLDLMDLVKCINNFHTERFYIEDTQETTKQDFQSEQLYCWGIDLKQYCDDSCKFVPNRISVTACKDGFNDTKLIGMHVYLMRTSSDNDTFFTKDEAGSVKAYSKSYVSTGSCPFITGNNEESFSMYNKKLHIPHFENNESARGKYVVEITGYKLPWDLKK